MVPMDTILHFEDKGKEFLLQESSGTEVATGSKILGRYCWNGAISGWINI